MSINTSYTNAAVTRANDFFSINQNDKIAKKGTKVFGRALTQSALTVAATAEAVVFAALTIALALPLAALSRLGVVSSERLSALTAHTKDAAKAGLNAVKSIVGRASKEDSKINKENQETSGYSKTAKAAAGLAVVAALVAGAYYSGAGSYIASFFQSTMSVVDLHGQTTNALNALKATQTTFENNIKAGQSILENAMKQLKK